MADNTKKLTYVIEINDKGKVKIDNLTKSFVNADNALNKLTADINKQKAAMAGATKDGLNPMIDKTGLAGATVVELGRTISDSNYGIRGMANNLSQLSTLMITLITTTGGLANGFRAIWAALSGPLGVIIVFQTLIALYEKYTMESDKAKSAASDFSKAIASSKVDLSDYLTIMEDIIITQSQLNTLLEGAAASDRKLYEFLEKSNLSQDERNKIIQQYLSLSNLILTVEEKLKETRGEIQEKGALASLMEIEALEKKIRVEKIAAEKTIGQDRAVKEASIGLLERELKAEKEKSSEIVRLRLKEAELFQILAKYRQDQLELTGKGSKFIREQLKTLDTFFDKFFFDIDKKGKIVFVNFLEDVEGLYKTVLESGIEGVEALAKIGEEYKRQVKQGEESLKNGLNFIKEQAKDVSDLFRAAQASLAYVNDVIMSYHDARMTALARERDYVLNSGKLTGDAQRKAIADIEKREIDAQRRKIKSERDLFTLKQSLLIAEEIMKFKFEVAARKRELGDKVATITAEGITQVGKASMSVGTFAAQGGPIGLATFAVTIGGLIASILAARKKAKAQLSALGAPSTSGGGGLGVDAPDFNVVGASPESQLAQSVSSQQSKPLRAFVVQKDIRDAQSQWDNIYTQSGL